MARHALPDGFLWGAATSAQQIEGARFADGRGDSIWDRFAAEEGRIADRSTPDVACDHYHRWRDDIALMEWMGLGAYRFSIAWPRILPEGTGRVEPRGLDFYDALVDGLLEAGIQPYPTLYHWDLPQALQDRGGWSERSTVDAFVEYTRVVVDRLGDRVRNWATHNEPWCVITLGHEEAHHAPGLRDPRLALRAAHHLLLSHGLATQAIRELVPTAEVGIVLIHCPVHPASEDPADRDAARWFDGFFNRWYLDPVFRGAYPEDAVADRIKAGHLDGPDLPFVHPGDMEIISTPLDFLGINYYSRSVMKAGPDGPMDPRDLPSGELTDMGWEVYPQGLTELLLRIHRDYAPSRIVIAENGAAYTDPPDDSGRIADTRRMEYHRGHLLALRDAVDQGVPVDGYFAWSLMDNFEWAWGYERRFGMFAIEPETLKRIPKDSAVWYRDVIAANAVDEAPIPTP